MDKTDSRANKETCRIAYADSLDNRAITRLVMAFSVQDHLYYAGRVKAESAARQIVSHCKICLR